MSINANIPAAIALPNRGQLRVSGYDAADLLQRLLTQNMERLNAVPLIYACLLSPQGKFLHDMFIRRNGDDFLIDCEGGTRGESLLKALTMYRLRSTVMFEYLPDVKVTACFNMTGIGGLPDPRHEKLGTRHYGEIAGAISPFSLYDAVRIGLKLPDGSRDAHIGDSTLAELNIAELAVDFKKGCFIGQELTARLHNLGHAKKHLVALRYKGAAPVFGAELNGAQGHFIGDARSHCDTDHGTIGLACLKDDALTTLPDEMEIYTP